MPSSSGSDWDDAPADDEFEVSVFGPGVGECVVVHLGNNEWMVVDSCRGPGPKRLPVALQYLSALGIGADHVRHIVVTHWHNDHHDGIADLVAACEQGALWCSAALQTREVASLLSAVAKHRLPNTPTGVDELARAMTELQARSEGTTRPENVAPRWMNAGTIVDRQHPRREVMALSPSPTEQSRAIQDLAAMVEAFEMTPRRLVPGANAVSVVLHLKLGDIAVLLGSDLEETGAAETGWSAVAAEADRLDLPAASILKVPHHGSATGHSTALWKHLVDGPEAVVTPFRPSRLPRPKDVQRLTQHAARVSLTAPARRSARQPLHRSVERSMRQVAKQIHDVLIGFGHVRMRFSDGREPVVTHFGDAAFCR